MEDISLVTYNNKLYYLYNNYIYSSLNLSRLFPIDTSSDIEFLSAIPNLSLYRDLTSYPALLVLSNGVTPLYYIITTWNNNIIIWGQEFANLNNYKVVNVVNIKFPDISRMIYNEEYQTLPELQSLPIDQRLISLLIKNADIQYTNIPIILMNVSTDEPLNNLNARNSYERLFKEFYESPIPIQYNGISGEFISFQQAVDLLSRGGIRGYLIDPRFQYLAVPQPPNYIITFFDINGHIYLLRAEFDPQTRKIYPSI